jgi:hypothetical protein
MIEKKNLRGDHYFMLNEMFNNLWDETVNDTTVLKAFPHYLIVGRDGRIVSNNAPRPSDALLLDKLRDILSGK